MVLSCWLLSTSSHGPTADSSSAVMWIPPPSSDLRTQRLARFWTCFWMLLSSVRIKIESSCSRLFKFFWMCVCSGTAPLKWTEKWDMPSVSLAALNKSLPDNMFWFVVRQWSEFIEISMIIIRLQKLALRQHAGKKLNVALESTFRLCIACCCVRGTSARTKTSVPSPPTGIPHLRPVMGLVWGALSVVLVQDIQGAGPQAWGNTTNPFPARFLFP